MMIHGIVQRTVYRIEEGGKRSSWIKNYLKEELGL